MNKRPLTSLITSRYDIRALATIARYYHEQGSFIKNKSTLPTEIVHDFEKLIIMNDLTEAFTSTSDAKDYLQTLGMNLVPDSVRLTYLKQLEIESVVPTSAPRESQDHTNDSVLDAIQTHKLSKTEGA